MGKQFLQRLVIVLILSTSSTVNSGAAAQAQDVSSGADSKGVHLTLYYVERGQVCLNNSDYDSCESIRTPKALYALVDELSPANVNTPPVEISLSRQSDKELLEQLSNYNEKVSNGQLSYAKRRSVLIVLDGSQGAPYSAEIERFSYSNNLCAYKSAIMNSEGVWFNHQAAEFFHPSRNCMWKLVYNGKIYMFKFVP
ncbi:MAG: hypothetical protein AAGU21_06680 [Solidesulfovibrio sp.]|uniref:hypothetical protein n=1 Tax=Solidesulfovibrio sp. TaxID=2910990 RepID=UPI003158237E